MSSAGCVDGSTAPEPSASASRIEQVRALRQELAAPAVELGRAVARLAATVEVLRLEPSSSPAARLAAVTAARTETVAELTAALETAGDVDIRGDGPDVQDVASAWRSATTAAQALVDAARAELQLVGRLATADTELEDLVAVWDEPGSRNQQLQAFAEAAERAESIAAELATIDPPAACLGDVARRIDAATAVARVTRELRRYVAGHQGNTFDRRRAELSQDPYQLGGPLHEVADPGCWDGASPAAAAASGVLEALEAVEAALNPDDLAPADAGAG